MPNSPQLFVDLDWRGTTVTLRCSGVIDMLTAPDLEQQISGALAQNPSAMIVDLTLVDFISSRGLWVLLDTYKRCSPTMGFAVVADGPATLRPLKLMGMTDVFPVRTSLTDALDDVAVPGRRTA
ncbi:STAS domain-containing protein [Mycobacterium sp. Root265]|uniref:STAS domain-containing protein n=1 Tax=Mycobacterium sp. Root265 TaxID=1736504 RepID=UPI0009EAD87D|nr:STAS domain-containing protein [Mycobacterium sp. Root265]